MTADHRAGSPETMSRAARLDAELGETDWVALPPGAERDTVAAPSGGLARIALGPADGRRVILVPGMTGSKEDFILMMPLLAAAGYRVESFDMAGQYESHGAGPEHLDRARHHYTLDLFTDDLLAVIDTGTAPVHLLGYSFAGTVAAAVAASHPDRVASLTMLSAPPLPGQALRGFKVLGPLSGMLPARVIARLMMWVVRNNLHGAPRHRAVFVKARFALTRLSSGDDIMGLMKRTPDLAPALRATGLPILVATGTGDVWPEAMHRAYADSMGAAALVLDTGHSPCETAPHQLTEAMLALFRR